MTVTDDGTGTAGPDGSGLTGMRERITASAAHRGPPHRPRHDPDRDRPRPRCRPVTIRTVLAEDQSMVLGAFASLLDLEPDIEVATAPDGDAR